MSGQVVSLNALPNGRSPGLRLLGECRDLLVDRLTLWLREIATPIRDELFILADSTRDRKQQTCYLDLRADIEQDWSQLVEHFRRTLGGTPLVERPGSTPQPLEIPDFAGLSLMNDADLSEHIVLREFSAQLSETCDDELYTLNRRLALLLDRADPSDDDHPLAPAVICDALSEACSVIGDNAEQRLVLLRRIERHLHSGLPPVYRQINAMLIERGILPDLIRTYRRNTPTGISPEGATSAVTPQAAMKAGTSTVPAAQGNETGSDILAALQRLAQSRGLPGAALAADAHAGSRADPASFAPAPAINAESIDLFLRNALSLLPNTTLPALAGAPILPLDGEMQGIVNQVRAVRESASAQQLAGVEAVTLDIVATLFDFIFDDADVPLATKALLSRLQIPVLKVAMLNPGFFADRQHPTRRFLAGIAGVAIRWRDDVDEHDPFYAKLAELVDRIQAEFEHDVEVFGNALTELEHFVTAHEAQEEDAALPATQLVLRREQEEAAAERAKRAVRDFLALRSIPAALSDFLNTHWCAVLQHLDLNAAPNDNNPIKLDWDKAIRLMDDLAWSIESKRAPDDRLRLVSLLPDLLSTLNKGLDRINTPPEERSIFFDALVKLHAAALKGETPTLPAPTPTASENASLAWSGKPPSEGELRITRSVDHGLEVEEIILVDATPVWRADERELQRQVGALKRGDWIEFRDEDGNTHRERLNWISPQRGILLFSNHRAAKAISIAPDALVRQIRDNKAAIVLPEAIFERALSGALDSLTANGKP